MTERTASHGTFVIERTYLTATPSRTFAAWTNGEAKGIWMDDPDYKPDGSASELEFKIGGHERFGGLSPGGTTYSYDATYYEQEGAEWMLGNLGKYLAAQAGD